MPLILNKEQPLYYQVFGEEHEDPILFIQGVGVIGNGWKPQTDFLSKFYSTAIFDNRGIGKSIRENAPTNISLPLMVSDVLSILNTLKWNKVHLIGHSMGGIIAQEFASQYPNRVKSLSLICTFPRGKDAARLTPWVLWVSLKTRIGSKHFRRKSFLEMIWSKKGLEKNCLIKLHDKISSLIGRDLANQPPILMKQIMALKQHDYIFYSASLTKIPTLILTSKNDPIAKPEYSQKIAEFLPHATYKEFELGSHAIPIEYSELINNELLHFIKNQKTTINSH